MLPLLAAGIAAGLLLAPAGAEAQGERPSIRISGGHVYIGGRHAGSVGLGRDPDAAGRLIRGRLLELGDPRAARFGPGRLGERSGFTRYPWWVHPRTRHAWPGTPRFGHPRFPHSRFPHPHGHPGAGLVIVLHHPFGAVFVAQGIGWWRWVESTTWTLGAAGVAPPDGPRAAPGGADEPSPEAPATRARPAPYEPPPGRCADVSVELLAGAVQRLRVDMAALGADTPEEVRAALEAQLRLERRLDVRGARGDGLVAPAALVRSLHVTACES